MQASPNPFGLIGQVGLRMAAQSGMQRALLQTAWSYRHLVVRRISFMSTLIAVMICAATWHASTLYLGHRARDIIATKDYATVRTSTYTHVHPQLRVQGDTAVVTRASRVNKRPVVRQSRVFVRAADHQEHVMASWLKTVAFWGMLLTPLLMLEQLWARRHSITQTARPAQHIRQQHALHHVTDFAGRRRRGQVLPAPPFQRGTSGHSSELNQSLFGG